MDLWRRTVRRERVNMTNNVCSSLITKVLGSGERNDNGCRRWLVLPRF